MPASPVLTARGVSKRFVARAHRQSSAQLCLPNEVDAVASAV